MRKFLLGLAVLAGVVVAAARAEAAPRFAGSVPVVSAASLLQPVQYYEDWRYREWRRREEFERERRHDEWRHERHAEHEREREREREHRGW